MFQESCCGDPFLGSEVDRWLLRFLSSLKLYGSQNRVFLSFFFLENLFSLSVVDLHSCVNYFCCTVKWFSVIYICAVAQLCLTLSMGILQARILAWVAIPFPRGSSQPRDCTQVSTLQVDSLLSEPPDGKKNTLKWYTHTHIYTYILKVFFLHAKRHSFNLKLTLIVLNIMKGNKIPHFKLTSLKGQNLRGILRKIHLTFLPLLIMHDEIFRWSWWWLR